MNRPSKGWRLFPLAVLIGVTLMGDVNGQSNKPGGNKPATSGGSRYTSPPKPSSPNRDKPRYTAPPSSKPSSPSLPGTSSGNDKPKFTAPSGNKPSGTLNSNKPGSGISSDKAHAAKQDRSERKFVESQKATAPPLAKYTSPDGKEVKVAQSTKAAQYIRNQPSTSLKPEVRRQNMTVFVEHHHYNHPYSWYGSQPTVYVGGGYSSAFWWIMMSEWDAQRRAAWLYNHRYSIESSAYDRGVRDAQVASYVNRMETQRSYRDPNYIDRDFSKDPSLMYTDDYVQATYNPNYTQSTPADSGAAIVVLCILGSLTLLGLICFGVFALFFRARFGS